MSAGDADQRVEPAADGPIDAASVDAATRRQGGLGHQADADRPVLTVSQTPQGRWATGRVEHGGADAHPFAGLADDSCVLCPSTFRSHGRAVRTARREARRHPGGAFVLVFQPEGLISLLVDDGLRRTRLWFLVAAAACVAAWPFLPDGWQAQEALVAIWVLAAAAVAGLAHSAIKYRSSLRSNAADLRRRVVVRCAAVAGAGAVTAAMLLAASEAGSGTPGSVFAAVAVAAGASTVVLLLSVVAGVAQCVAAGAERGSVPLSARRGPEDGSTEPR